MKYFFSIAILLLCQAASIGQASRFVPSAIRIGADPGTLGYMIFSKKRNFLELEADMDVDRFFVVADYGASSFKLDESTYTYDNSGSYMRFGADINFMHKDPHYNVAFFGLRYGTAKFRDQLDYNTRQLIQSSTGWPDSRETASNTGAKANWFEINTGLKIRIIKQLYTGFTLRYKIFMKVHKTDGELRPYYIPGFGKNIGSSAWGFNYYVSYRIPFRKKIIYTDTPVKKKKQKSKLKTE